MDTTNPKDLIGEKKAPLWLIPGAFLIVLAWVMGLGAKKYGPYNWRGKKVKLTVYIAAAQRHLISCLDGEWTDPESGQPHLGHAAACCAIVIDAYFTGNLIDDRPPAGVSAKMIADTMVKDVPQPPTALPSITTQHWDQTARLLYQNCPDCGSLAEVLGPPLTATGRPLLAIHPCRPVTSPAPGVYTPTYIPCAQDRPTYPDCSGRDEHR